MLAHHTGRPQRVHAGAVVTARSTITGALVAGLIALTGCASTPTGMDKFRSDWAKGSADTRDVICDGVREYGATWSANIAADSYPKVSVTQIASFLNEVC